MILDPFQSQTTISWLASHRVITYGPKQIHRSVLRTLLKKKTIFDRQHREEMTASPPHVL